MHARNLSFGFKNIKMLVNRKLRMHLMLSLFYAFCLHPIHDVCVDSALWVATIIQRIHLANNYKVL